MAAGIDSKYTETLIRATHNTISVGNEIKIKQNTEKYCETGRKDGGKPAAIGKWVLHVRAGI